MDKINRGLRLLLVLAAVAAGRPAASQETLPSAPVTPPTVQPPAVIPLAPTPPAAVIAVQPPEPTLPPIPAAPQAALPAYPDCKNDHASARGSRAKAIKVSSCIDLLDGYNESILQVFARRMGSHRDALWARWLEVDHGPFSAEQKREFYGRINAEFTSALEDGPYMDQYRATYARYRADRAYLQTEFCNLARCPQRPQ